jgi:CheY-like chemotaxis protein
MPNPTIRKRDGSNTIHIILVEDNAGDLSLLEKALQSRRIDYKLARFDDGEQAIRAASGRVRRA